MGQKAAEKSVFLYETKVTVYKAIFKSKPTLNTKL